MSRDEYLQTLRDNLTTMSDDEKDDVIRYYLEYFIDSGDEQAAIEELGRPEALADRLCGTHNYRREIETPKHGQEYGGESECHREPSYRGEPSYSRNMGSDYGTERRRFSAGKIIALICTFPIWLPIAIVAVVLAFVAVIVAAALVFSLFAAFAAMVFAGVVSIIAGFAALGKSVADGLLVSGMGLLAAGIGIFVFFLGQLAFKGMRHIFSAIRAKRI